MQYGFLKTAAASFDTRLADPESNVSSMLSVMSEAASLGVQLLVFPELCLTGYCCGDLFFQPTLLEGAERAAKRLLRESTGTPDLIVVVGAPVRRQDELYNCALVLKNGELLGIVPKTCLPNYGEFCEKRYFSPAPAENSTLFFAGHEAPFGTRLLFCCSSMPEFRLAVEICEDLWAPVPPSSSHALAGATVIANPSASNELIGKDDYRRMLVTGQSARLAAGYVFSGCGEGESTTDLVFGGHCMVAENGVMLAETAPLSGDKMAISELDLSRLSAERLRLSAFPGENRAGYTVCPFSLPIRPVSLTRLIPRMPFVPDDLSERSRRCERILSMQASALSHRLSHTRAKTAVIGISGGLDSCLALLVCVRAMDRLCRPRTDVVAVTMPCFGTTRRTRSNAEKLSELLGVTLRCVDISESVLLHFRDIGHSPEDHSVTFENAQARERTQVLMDISNQTGGMVIGTGDLSELALGWATYNGDHMSMYGVNASSPKTLIRHLVAHAAKQTPDAELSAVLRDILDTPVSPELLPAKDGEISQKTEHLVGPYELHDFFLYYIVRWAFPPAKVYYLARTAFAGDYDDETILYWLRTFYRRFFSQQFKRSCLPDGPKTGSVGLSPRGDWRMPSDALADLWLSQADALSAR